MINIVLFEPEEAPNTGNIGRTCVCIGARLHLIEPLGFQLTDKKIRRAGLDYWGRLDVTRYMDYNDFMERNPGAEVYYATTKARYRYSDVQYKDNVFIMFGKESAGIPEEILVQHPDHCIRIPMKPEERSLNLSNAVSIVACEAMRQMDFPELEDSGNLHRLSWDDEI